MKKGLTLIAFALFINVSTKATISISTEIIYNRISVVKPVIFIAVADSLPALNTLVRTHVNINGNIAYEQKAILKEDGWHWPSGVTKLPWIPTHWESM